MTGSPVTAGVRVRAPAEPDMPAIAGLLTQLGYPTSVDQARSRIALLDVSPANHVLVAEADGGVVGLAALEVGLHIEKDGKHGQLTALVTEARLRRRGVARTLLTAVEKLARDEECELLFLRSNKRRNDAHAFYRTVGYEETHRTFNKKL